MKCLDLFCGAGGASMGYHRAGFEMTGVDNRPQPNYPFRFIEVDALWYLERHGREYDLIVASPPCQKYSSTKNLPGRNPDDHPDLLVPVRSLLWDLGRPYILENVPGAAMVSPILLCGTMFGLHCYRHRLFESQLPLVGKVHEPHERKILRGPREKRLTSYGAKAGDMVTVAGHQFSREAGSAAMKIGWMTRNELAQAIPPDYTEHLGRQAFGILRDRRVRLVKAG